VAVGLWLCSIHRNSIVIRMRGFGTIIATAISLVVWMAIQVTRIWEQNAPCVFIFFVVQLVIATISSLIFNRTYSILYKLAIQEKALKMMELVARQRKQAVEVPDLEDENCCVANIHLLRLRYRLTYSVGQFCVIMVLFIANPINYTGQSLEPSENCNVSSSLYAGLFLLLLFIVVSIGFRFLEVQDSFHMIEEITLCALGVVTFFILLGIIQIIGYTMDIPEQTQRDLEVDVAVLQQLVVAIFIVLMPGIWSGYRQKNQGKILKPDLIRVLAHTETLQLFKNHLIKEWSVENLLFYEQVTKIQVRSRQMGPERSLLRCVQTYDKYISSDAVFEVNLSGPVANPLHDFFKRDVILSVLPQIRNRQKSKRQTGSETDFVAIVERIAKNHEKTKDVKDGKHSELARLSDECLQLLLQARNEVFRLLKDDSYARFIRKPDVQMHFREFKGILMAQNVRKKSYGNMAPISERAVRVGSRVGSKVGSKNKSFGDTKAGTAPGEVKIDGPSRSSESPCKQGL